MERNPQRQVSFHQLCFEPACQKLSLVDRALVTVEALSVPSTAGEFIAQLGRQP